MTRKREGNDSEADVPLLIGSNADEARSLVDVTHVKAATFGSDLEHSFGALPPPLVSAYPYVSDAEAKQARLDLERDLRFGWDMWAPGQSCKLEPGRIRSTIIRSGSSHHSPPDQCMKVVVRATSLSSGTSSII